MASVIPYFTPTYDLYTHWDPPQMGSLVWVLPPNLNLIRYAGSHTVDR